MATPEAWGGALPLPGEQLAGVALEDQRALYADALKPYRLRPEELDTGKVPGFTLKPELRPVVVRPEELRVRPADPDPMNHGKQLVRLAFRLPRGAYATLVVRRLIGPPRPHEPRSK